MGRLAIHLAGAFQRKSPLGWRCSVEEPIFDERLALRYGFNPRADVLFCAPDGRRIAVEFEISRADPVANQVKFLVARNVGAIGRNDVLVSMFSSHIARGRRNVASAFVRHMRTEGISAFQVSLLPHVAPLGIQSLNDQTESTLIAAKLPIVNELERVWAIAEPRGEREHRIHFAGDVTDVMANIWAWNDEMDGPARETWGRRQVQFFAQDPISGLFAPSKFCAFIPLGKPGGPSAPDAMNLAIYASLGEQDPRFDGNRARSHLEKRLAFQLVALDDKAPAALTKQFDAWHRLHADRVPLRRPASVLVPPLWYSE